MIGREQGRKWLLIGQEERRRAVTEREGALSLGRLALARFLEWGRPGSSMGGVSAAIARRRLSHPLS